MTLKLHFPVVKVEASEGCCVNIGFHDGVVTLSELKVVVFFVVTGKDGGDRLVLALEGDTDKACQWVLFLLIADFFSRVGKGIAGSEGVVDQVADALGEGTEGSQFMEGAEGADVLECLCGEVLNHQFTCLLWFRDGLHSYRLYGE